MTTKRPRAIPSLVAATITAALAGCAYFGPPAGVSASSYENTSNLTCQELAMVDDANDGDDQILTLEGRAGYIYTFADEVGTQISPSEDAFQVTPGGVDDTGSALRITGTLATGGTDIYAGVGFGFTEPAGPYDASKYTGIAFNARRGPDSTPSIRVKLPDAWTATEGGKCKECYNDFGVSFALAEEWTHYEVAFSDLKQEEGWGDPRPETVDPKQLFGIQWQVSQPGATFDIWIDDITFIGCEGNGSEVQQ